MKISVKELSELVDGKIIGDENELICEVARIYEAKKGELTFLYHPAYQKYLETTKASAVLISDKFERIRKDITYIVVDKPDIALNKIIIKFFDTELSLNGIAKSAHIAGNVKLGENVSLGENVVIEKNSEIGSNTKIFHNTTIMENVKIGKNVLIYPNVVVRENSVIGDNVIIHSGSVIGSDGFGYAPNTDGSYTKIPQIGNVILEDDVEIGSNVSIDRAALGSTIIKKGTKIDNLVQVAHNCSIGSNTVISAQTGISGSTNIGNNCVIAGQVGFAGHLNISDKVMIGAQSGISKSITKPGKYFGYPAKEMSIALRQEAHIRNLEKYANKIKELEKKIKELETKVDKC